MFLRAVLPACLLSVAVHAGTQLTQAKIAVTPIQEVLMLMEGLKAKGIAAKNNEETKFSAFAQWCESSTGIKMSEIKTDTETIGMDKAYIQEDRVDIKHDVARVLELKEDIGRWEKDQKSATAVRDAERADFTATITDYTESIDAVAEAINVLRKQSRDQAQAGLIQIQKAALIHVRSLKVVPPAAKKALSAFLQQDPELAYAAPEANGYEFQSGGVVEMLEQLQEKFTSKKTDLEKEELNAQHGFEQIMQQLADSIEIAESEIAEKTKHRGQTAGHKAEVEGDLSQMTVELDEDQKDKSEIVALCTQTKADFENRQKLRGEEIVAISEAIEIMGSQAVAGSGDKHLPALMQIRKKHGVALASLRSDHKSPQQQKVAAFLADRARKSGSSLLSEIAAAAETNPFSKVKKMIQDLIRQLMEEAHSEKEHHGWCQTELATNKQTRERKTSEINQLESDIEVITATIATLMQEMADLTDAVKELNAARAKETEERNEAKATNAQTVKDAKAAQIAVEQAIAVLKDFYAKSAEATSFVQQPETFEKPYKGLLSAGGNVVDMLQVILTDFTRLESETTLTEAEEADTYKAYMTESKKDVDMKESLINGKSGHKTEKESALLDVKADLRTTHEQLNSALNYYEKLKPTCVDSGITKEERDRRREEEIVSLQEALTILQGTDLPTMG